MRSAVVISIVQLKDDLINMLRLSAKLKDTFNLTFIH